MCYRRLSSILATGIYIMRFAGLSIIIHSLVGNGTKQLGRLAGFLPSIAAMSEVAYPHRDRGNQGELELERTRPQAWPQGQSTFQKTTHRTNPRKRYINQPCLRRSSAGADNQAPRNGAPVPRLNPAFPILSLAFGTAIIEGNGSGNPCCVVLVLYVRPM